jgi:hypothetical protein
MVMLWYVECVEQPRSALERPWPPLISDQSPCMQGASSMTMLLSALGAVKVRCTGVVVCS